MGTRPVLRIVFSMIALLLMLSCGQDASDRASVKKQSQTTAASYTHIISSAPNITETLFALGLGDRVAGVTKFCLYPPEAQEKSLIGGYLDMNFEAVASLEPDCVFCLPGHDELRSYLDKLDIHHVTVPNESVADILETIETIGDVCGVEAAATEMIESIRRKMTMIAVTVPEEQRPTVLISIGREMGTGTIKDVYIAGKGTFYNELVRYAGGKNAYTGPDILYPSISSESLLTLNPDIIIEIVPDLETRGIGRDDIIADWKVLKHINAVKNNDIYVLFSDYTVIPGPRFIMLLEDLAKILQD